MTRCGTILLLIALLCSCNGGKKNINPFAALTNEVDSARANDSLTTADMNGETMETEEPTKEDGAFDDFIYNFTSDHALQMRRIKFPLPVLENDTRKLIDKREWEHEDLFTSQEYYTLLFNSEEEMEGGEDLSATTAYVEWLYPSTGMQKQYFFGVERGAWMLDSILVRPINNAQTADFVAFYGKFATDSTYQASHISPHLSFVTTDPDDDFSVIETTLDLNQWFAFAPSLPADKLSNICYGTADEEQPSNKRILVLRGMGNGLSNAFYFKARSKGNWELYRFEDVGI
jgi:hypothetical protein